MLLHESLKVFHRWPLIFQTILVSRDVPIVEGAWYNNPSKFPAISGATRFLAKKTDPTRTVLWRVFERVIDRSSGKINIFCLMSYLCMYLTFWFGSSLATFACGCTRKVWRAWDELKEMLKAQLRATLASWVLSKLSACIHLSTHAQLKVWTNCFCSIVDTISFSNSVVVVRYIHSVTGSFVCFALST